MYSMGGVGGQLKTVAECVSFLNQSHHGLDLRITVMSLLYLNRAKEMIGNPANFSDEDKLRFRININELCNTICIQEFIQDKLEVGLAKIVIKDDDDKKDDKK